MLRNTRLLVLVVTACCVALGQSARAQTQTATIPLGTMPSCSAFKAGQKAGEPGQQSDNAVVMFGAVDESWQPPATPGANAAYYYQWKVEDRDANGPRTVYYPGPGPDDFATVGDRRYLPVQHSFERAGNFLATLRVIYSTDAQNPVAGIVAEGEAVLPVEVREPDPTINPDELETRIAITIQDNLRYLYTVSWAGDQPGSIGNNGYQALALLAFLNQGHRPGMTFQDSVYGPMVTKLFEGLLLNLTCYDLTPQPNYTGDPNPNDPEAATPPAERDGYGLAFEDDGDTNYATGIFLMALAGVADQAPGMPVVVADCAGGSGATRQVPIESVIRDVVEYFAWAQADDDSSLQEGGWRYGANDGEADNSAAQWPALGMLEAENLVGIAPPAYVKQQFKKWILRSQVHDAPRWIIDIGSGPEQVWVGGGMPYSSTAFDLSDNPKGTNWINIPKTGGQIAGMQWADPVELAENIELALNFCYHNIRGQREFSISDGSSGAFAFEETEGPRFLQRYGDLDPTDSGNYYGMYSCAKSFRTLGVSLLTDRKPGQSLSAASEKETLPSIDWYRLFADFITRQTDHVNGNQPWGEWGSPQLTTSFSILILTQTVVGGVPVPVIDASAVLVKPGQVIEFSGARSHHLDRDRTIVSYAWDFGDGSTATGKNVTHSFDVDLQVGESRTFLVHLAVTDDDQPPVTRETGVEITVTRENVPPVADPGGPYVILFNSPTELDGSGSYDPDGSAITYLWDLNGDGVFGDSADDAIAGGAPGASRQAKPVVTYADLGEYRIALRVEDPDGGFNTARTTLVTVVDNLPPTVVIDRVGSSQQTVVAPTSADSTQADTVVIVIPCGDGSEFPVRLDASRSFDQDGDPLQFTWHKGGVTVDGPQLEIARRASDLPGTFLLEVNDGEHTIEVTVQAQIDLDAPPESITMDTVYLKASEADVANFYEMVKDMIPAGCAEPIFAINSYDTAHRTSFDLGTNEVQWVFAFADGSRVRSRQLVIVSENNISGGASGCSYAGRHSSPAAALAFALLVAAGLAWRWRVRRVQA